MANIGTFTKTEQGFVGEIVTLSFQAKNVRMVPETQRHQRERPEPPRLCRPRRDRRRLGQALQRGPQLPVGQARRPELQRSDLREPLRRRRRRELHAHLVARPQGQRRLSQPSDTPPGPPGGVLRHGRRDASLTPPGRRHRPARGWRRRCSTETMDSTCIKLASRRIPSILGGSILVIRRRLPHAIARDRRQKSAPAAAGQRPVAGGACRSCGHQSQLCRNARTRTACGNDRHAGKTRRRP